MRRAHISTHGRISITTGVQNAHQWRRIRNLPAELRDGYAVVEIKAEDPKKTCRCLRSAGGGAEHEVVGIERKW